ncbi:HPr family phosphocarrier protein [Caproiciproducens galactitolivorans]|uniref:Phosphocarrier protein HPr n=1 Tax=Caproiciproducens galactitolivorans TaxID=642589 RepID=A0A4Z0YBQ8_9FIRM|nr:HPr family phosphocarrier protein [Caproiciproducens galactitolivorans]QEY34898.1 HPr family phosphocarrier protein [Caproiciproducens galactitolivorans]TGJ76400.1 phosphocarrier protein HPr [Caproiciproducens galactitolivorans]
MYSRKTTINNQTGLHARPASDFVKCASQFKSKITIKNVDDDETVSAKSIILILSLSLSKGMKVEITAEGEDEVKAVDTLVALIDSKFGE